MQLQPQFLKQPAPTTEKVKGTHAHITEFVIALTMATQFAKGGNTAFTSA